MKKLISIIGLLVILVAISLNTGADATATGKIKGTVTDRKTGDPIPAATVVLGGTTFSGHSNPEGKYIIINIPPGSYSLMVSAVGYKSVTVSNLTVAASNVTVQDFKLEPMLNSTDCSNIPVPDEAPPDVFTEPLSRERMLEEVKKMHMLKGFDAEYGNAQSGLKSALGFVTTGYPMAHGGNTPPNGAAFDAMFFKHYGVNPFVSTEDDHLSTFAIDTDNASYSMTRSYINRGHLPPDEAVRVEEFVNNFKYSYDHPWDQAFKISFEGAPSKFGKNYQLLKIGIVGKKIKTENRKDANLVFVIDVSGSMGREDRLGLVRKSLRMLVDNLTTRDRVGIVIYGSNARVLLEPTSINDKDKIITAIEQLHPQGSTNAEAGLRLGYRMADRCFTKGAINRIILCSDGVANVGRTGAEDLLKDIKKYADKGITLSSIGFGMGNFNDVLLEKLGNKGNGSYAYVDNWMEAKRVFMDNLTGMLQVIARDVKIQVDFNPDVVDRYRLLGYENRDVDDDKFRDDKEDGGEIGSGHQVTALYEIKLKENATGDIGTVYVRHKDPDSFEVTEVSHKITRETLKNSFESTSTDFRLAAAAAEFAEILRKSYWAKGSDLSSVLEVVRQLESERSSEQVIEFMNLIAQADKMKQAEETSPESFGQK